MKINAITLLGVVFIASLVATSKTFSQEDGGGAGAAQSVDPTAPLAQIRFQNYFIPSTRDADGYANTFVIQPVIPMYLNSEIFPYHILRPTLPILNRANPIGSTDNAQGVGDLTLVDIFVHPIEELNVTMGGGYVAVLPTSTDRSVGRGEWELGPNAFAVTTAIPNWVIGGLVQAPFSVESDAYSLEAQLVMTRLLEDEWYVGWGNTVLKFDDQDGNYNIPLQAKIGKVAKIGGHPFDIFIQGEFTPRGFQSLPGEEWGILFNIGTMLPDFKFGPLCGGR